MIAKLGGEYWATGEMRANRYDLLAAWSPDSRAVIEVANSRWDSDAFAYYLMDGATVTKLDLRTLVEPAMKAKLPARKRELYSFRVLDDPPVTLDARGHARFKAIGLCTEGRSQPGLQGAGRHLVEAWQAIRADRVDAAGQVGLGLQITFFECARSAAPRPRPSRR